MQNYQILVCEDEVEIGNAIEIYLKNQGYGVHPVSYTHLTLPTNREV